ncbi:MAG: F0F1 ATP synthase subunit gamma [Gammaproteobacteria bacterium]|nr:F0F1 ATP synthase subunit gamma [Gammaproteobacteria bacterium]
MSRRHEVEQHLLALGDIRGIMNSMKTLAYMETRKLARFLEVQREAVQQMQAVAEDFLGHYPGLAGATTPQTPQMAVLFGSERGFCGDFNESLVDALKESGIGAVRHLVVVGHKLGSRMEREPKLAAIVGGASAAEDVEAVLLGLTQSIARLQTAEGPFPLVALYHAPDTVQPLRKPLLPPFTPPARALRPRTYPPLLNLPPAVFFAGLVEHYVFAALHEIAYVSLMAENQRRVRHLDGAVRHLDEQSEAWARRSNAMRQEDITEEIESILLGAMDT